MIEKNKRGKPTKPTKAKIPKRRKTKSSPKKGHKCKICQNNEHRTKNCPRTLCTYCGKMKGHHTNVGENILCSNISSFLRKDIIEVDESQHCSNCKTTGHTDHRCPLIWRKYKPKDLESENIGRIPIAMHTIFCYNCGLKGHYGDDCLLNEQQNRHKFTYTAFSGKNLSSAIEQIYYERLQSSNIDDKIIVSRPYSTGRRSTFFKPPYKNLRPPEFTEDVQLLG